MEYNTAYYLLWKKEYNNGVKLQRMLDEIMTSYEESIKIQKQFLNELTSAKNKINDLETQSRSSWCCSRRSRNPPPY